MPLLKGKGRLLTSVQKVQDQDLPILHFFLSQMEKLMNNDTVMTSEIEAARLSKYIRKAGGSAAYPAIEDESQQEAGRYPCAESNHGRMGLLHCDSDESPNQHGHVR